MGTLAEKNDIILQLQKEILSMQGSRVASEKEHVDTGLGVMEASFAEKKFPTGTIHEFISYGREQAAATNSFITCLLGKLLQSHNGYCIWVSVRKAIYPAGLKRFGMDADRILFVEANKNADALWTIEEALKCNQVTAVVGEVPDLSFTDSRRLQLAVESSRVTGFMHRCYPRQENTVACVSRWRITPIPSQTTKGMPGVGFPRWEVSLSKIRNGYPGKWTVEWAGSDFIVTDTHSFASDSYTIQSGMYG